MNKSFTLIEVILVLVILSIMADLTLNLYKLENKYRIKLYEEGESY